MLSEARGVPSIYNTLSESSSYLFEERNQTFQIVQ